MKFDEFVSNLLMRINYRNLKDIFKAFPHFAHPSDNKIVRGLLLLLVNGFYLMIGNFDKNLSVNSIS